MNTDSMTMTQLKLIGKTSPVWTTVEEKAFLDKIETFSTAGFRNRHGKHVRNAMLRGYMEGAKRRTEWGFVKKSEVVGYCLAELMQN